MEMQKISSGQLRAIGYDARERLLQVQLDDGRVLQFSGVSEESWRRLSTAASPWSYFRDNIEEEYTAKHVASNASSAPAAGKNPLDDLFK